MLFYSYSVEQKPDWRRRKINVTLSMKANDRLKHEYTHNCRKREREMKSCLICPHIRLKYSDWDGWISGFQMSVCPLAKAWVKLCRDLFVAPPVTPFIRIAQWTREVNTNDKWTTWELTASFHYSQERLEMISVKLRFTKLYGYASNDLRLLCKHFFF